MSAQAKYAGQICNICYQNSSNYNCIQCSFVICKNCRLNIQQLKLDNACGQCRKIKPWIENDVDHYKILTIQKYIEAILKILLYFTIILLIFILSLTPIVLILVYIVGQLFEIIYNMLSYNLMLDINISLALIIPLVL